MLEKEKTERVMCERELKEARALAIHRQSEVIEREAVIGKVKDEAEAIRRELEGERIRYARNAEEWETKEKQLGEELKRSKEETAR